MRGVRVFNLTFTGLNRNNITDVSHHIKFVTTVNAEFIVEANCDPDFKSILDNSVSTFDGQVPYVIARLLTRMKFDKISGSDLIYDVFKRCSISGHKVFLLGDTETVNTAALNVGRQCYGVECDGYSPPMQELPFCNETDAEILYRIKEFRPTYLFVAFGAKKQEKWINQNIEHLESLGVRWVIGCGGSIAFFAGAVQRAPVYIQKIGLESVYRIIQQPKLFRVKRLFRSLLLVKYI